jgi:hypothetical protein
MNGGFLKKTTGATPILTALVIARMKKISTLLVG